MKENSIKEDIVKKFEEFCEDLYIFKDDDMGGHFEGVVGDQIANTKLGYLIFKEELEDFLSDYKRVLKENEELLELKVCASAHNRILKLEKENEELKNFKKQVTEIESTNFIKYKNYISKQKVKDKIEELDEELEIMKVDNMYGRYKEYGGKLKWERLFATKYGMQDALQEILEGRK